MRITGLILLLLLSITTFGASESEIDGLHHRIYPLMKTAPDSAMLLANEALEQAKGIGYDWGIANSYYIQGYIYESRNELSAALLMYLRASQILKYSYDSRSIENYMEILTNCGVILRKHSKFEEAIRFFDDAIQICESEGWTNQKTILVYNKASVYHDMGSYDKGIETLNEGIGLAKQDDNSQWLVNCWNLMSLIHKDLSQYEESKYYLKFILEFKFTPDEEKAMALHNLGQVYELQNKLDSSEYAFLKALDIERKLPDGIKDKWLFLSAKEVANLYLEQGRYAEGIKKAQLSLSYYSRTDVIPNNYSIFKTLSDLYYQNKDTELSHAFMSRFYEENAKFQEHQEEVMKLRDKFRIDILLAGFYNEVDKENSTSMYQMIIGFLIIGIVLWVGVSRVRVNVVRKQLEREIHRINKDSLV